MADVLVNTSIGAQLNVLEALGLNGKSLRTVREWATTRNVTLRLKAEERCEFDREEKHEEESATKHVRDYGVGSITDKVVTTVTEYFWRFECVYEVSAFAGSDSEDKVVLQGRTCRYEIKRTGSKEAPRPKVAIRDAVDCNVTWLLGQVSSENVLQFAVRREEKECRTPRRNRQAEAAIEYFERFERWCEAVHRYFTQTLFPVQTGHGLALNSVNDNTVFVPVLPVFIENKKEEESEAAAGHQGGALVSLGKERKGPVLSTSDLGLFLEEEKRSLAEKNAELAKIFPDHSGQLITVAEATLLVAALHGERITHYLVAGLDFIEDMLREQVVAAIGKELTAADFGSYMVYHNRKVFRAEYQPRAFCYAIRRPNYYPEGIVSIEGDDGTGSMVQPVQTMVNETELLSPMRFAIAASAKVDVGGRVFVHGLMMHQFEDAPTAKLTLSVRARQFSSFLVLVGRIAGPGLFDPQFGIICQNKDEITIPLDVETIPSAGEFKAATVSISPEQQAFAKMYRGMQLASTLFAVCVIQIKPQMERVLKLTSEALTKEIQLTQDLLELFIQYQIPSDLLSYGGSEGAGRDARLAGVKRNVRSVQLTIEWEKLKETEESLKVAEMRAIEAVQREGLHSLKRVTDAMHSLSRRRDDDSEVILEGGRRGKINQAKKALQAPPEPVVEVADEMKIEEEQAAPPPPEEAFQSEAKMEEKEKRVMEEEEDVKESKMDRKDEEVADKKKSRKKVDVKKKRHVASSKSMEKEEREEKKKEYDPYEEQRRQQEESVRQIKLDFEKKRKELEQRRASIVAEKQALEQQGVQAFEASAGPMIRVEGAPATAPPAVVDYTKIPAALDEALERLDTDGALRPSIINVGKVWNKSSQEGLLGARRSAALTVTEQKLEKNTCYDLLDALTRSGGLGITDAAVHIVVSTTHCFGRNLMDTLVKDNVNPIDKVEHTQLIVASHVFQKSATELLKPEEVARVKQNSPTLFE